MGQLGCSGAVGQLGSRAVWKWRVEQWVCLALERWHCMGWVSEPAGLERWWDKDDGSI